MARGPVPLIVIERHGRVAPLGVRFRDPLSGGVVADGLVVEAWPAAAPSRRKAALVNTTGVFGWVDLPGVRERTFGRGDDAYWQSQAPSIPFVVEVQDASARFLPFRFSVHAPSRGIWTWGCEPDMSPPSALDSVPLHSAPTRVPGGAVVVIRAELRDARTGGPAAWAVVHARIAGQRPHRGISDARGRLLLLAPYPEPLVPPASGGGLSPPGSARVPLWDQRWPVQLDVFYEPSAEVPPDIPDLCELLHQGPATAWSDADRRDPLEELTLRYGRELHVRTGDADGAVFVMPATSPP